MAFITGGRKYLLALPLPVAWRGAGTYPILHSLGVESFTVGAFTQDMNSGEQTDPEVGVYCH